MGTGKLKNGLAKLENEQVLGETWHKDLRIGGNLWKLAKPVNVMAITNVFLHLEPGYDLNINDGNLDNHKGEIVQSNSIILSLPVNQMYNNMVVYNNEDGGNSFMFKCNRQETISSLCVTIRDQYYQLVPNFPDCHLILQFQKKLKEDKYGNILNKC